MISVYGLSRQLCLFELLFWSTCQNFTLLTEWGRSSSEHVWETACAQLLFFLLSASDVFFLSPAGCYYRLWREDLSEDVSLLLCHEGQSSNQRESLTRDLPVSQSVFGRSNIHDVKKEIVNLFILSKFFCICVLVVFTVANTEMILWTTFKVEFTQTCVILLLLDLFSVSVTRHITHIINAYIRWIRVVSNVIYHKLFLLSCLNWYFGWFLEENDKIATITFLYDTFFYSRFDILVWPQTIINEENTNATECIELEINKCEFSNLCILAKITTDVKVVVNNTSTLLWYILVW